MFFETSCMGQMVVANTSTHNMLERTIPKGLMARCYDQNSVAFTHSATAVKKKCKS